MALFCDSLLCDISTLLVVFLSALLFIKHRFTYWKRHGISQIDPSSPFGNTGGIVLRKNHAGDVFHSMYKELKKRNVSFGGYYNIFKPELLLVTPEIHKQILIKDFQHFTDRLSFSDEKNDPLTGHLFALTGTKWKNLRAKLSPTFTSGKMKMMFHTMVATSDELNNILEVVSGKAEPLDIKDLLARFTTDVIGSCAFGLECNSLKDPETDFRKYGQKVFKLSNVSFYKRLVASLYPQLFKYFKISLIDREISRFFMGVVKDTVKYREENNVRRKDFLQLLLELKNKGQLSDDDGSDTESRDNNYVGDGKTLTIEEMAAQCFVFFLAGFETSSTTMAFCLYELTQNPDIQEKLREEIITALKKYNGELTYNGIMEMQYLDKVVNETLRKHPVVTALERKCTQEYILPNTNCRVKVGDTIRISVLGLHKDPEYYPNPDKFDPERFSEEEKNKRPSCTYLPFGDGPRICIGLRFGLMQAKVGIAVLLRNYRFTLNNKTKQPLKKEPGRVGISAEGGIWLDVHKIVS